MRKHYENNYCKIEDISLFLTDCTTNVGSTVVLLIIKYDQKWEDFSDGILKNTSTVYFRK